MELFTRCSGECKNCISHYSLCLAGHGDDDFSPMTKKAFDLILENKYIQEYKKNEMKKNFPHFIEKNETK